MTIIERIKEYLNPTIVRVGEVHSWTTWADLKNCAGFFIYYKNDNIRHCCFQAHNRMAAYKKAEARRNEILKEIEQQNRAR